MTKLNFQDILWIFSHPKPQIIPSYLVGGINPANFLGIKKVIFLNNHDPEELIKRYNPKCLIISKVFNSNINNLLNLASRKKIKIISIFDDWIFPDKMRENINLPIAKISDVIVAKTKAAADHISDNTKLRCQIIPDPIRFKTNQVFKKINKPLNICWFGMDTNHDTILNEVSNLNNLNIEIKLTIISNYIENINTNIKRLNINNVLINFLQWNENSYRDIINSEVIILPYPKDKKRLVKSSNRIIDSLNLGRFTILSNVEQFKEFKDFTYFGDISEGILWFQKNINKAIERTIKGQNYVLQNYSLSKICNKWKEIIESL